MALTEREVQFLQNLKEQGVSKDDAINRLTTARQAMATVPTEVAEREEVVEAPPTFLEQAAALPTRAQRAFGQTAAAAAPFLTGGIITREQVQERAVTGLGTGVLGQPIGRVERAAGVAGTGVGVGAQIVPVGRGVQAAGRGLQSVRGLSGIGNAIRSGGITTAAAEGAVFGALQPGNVEERARAAAVGAGAGAAVGTALRGAGAARRAITEELPAKLTSTALGLTKAQTKRVNKIIGEMPEEFILRKGLTGSPEKIADDLEGMWRASKDQVDTALKGSRFRGKNKAANDLLDDLESFFEGTRGNEDIIAEIQTLKTQAREKAGLSLPEMNRVKRLVDQKLSLFGVTGDPKTGAIKEGILNNRSKLQTFIEKEALKDGIDVKALNKETQASRLMSDLIRERAQEAGTRSVISLTDTIIGTGGFAATDDPLTAVGIVVGKKILENPTFKTNLAKQLRKFAPDDVTAIESFLRRVRGSQISQDQVRQLKQAIGSAQEGIQ